MKWDEMTPEERDAFIAERVMKWHKTDCIGFDGVSFTAWHDEMNYRTGWLPRNSVHTMIGSRFNPTKDFVSAFQVIRKFDEIKKLINGMIFTKNIS